MGRHDLDSVNARLDGHHKVAALTKALKHASGHERTVIENRIDRTLHAQKKRGGPLTPEEGKRMIAKACKESPAIRRNVAACFPGREAGRRRRSRRPVALPDDLKVE